MAEGAVRVGSESHWFTSSRLAQDKARELGIPASARDISAVEVQRTAAGIVALLNSLTPHG